MRSTARSGPRCTNLDGAGRLASCSSLRRCTAAEHLTIAGTVTSGEARIRLKVKGPRRQEQEIDAVIDTGYTGALTLPRSMVAALGLSWQSVDRGTLADGSECLVDVYEAQVMWDGKPRRILVDEVDTAPLVGMVLLSGYELKVQVRSRGKVTTNRLP